MSLYYISQTNWNHLLKHLIKQAAIYGLVPEGDHLVWQKIPIEKVGDIVVNRYRSLQPVKTFFFPIREDVTGEPAHHKTVIIGLKACDLAHLQITDAMFLGGILADPYYAAKRQNTFIISADCDACRASCFCTKMGSQPFPKKGFDLNLSPVGSGYLVETGSEKGEQLVAGKRHLFQEPQPHHLQEREQHRQQIIQKVKECNKEFTWENPKEIVSKEYGAKELEEIAKPCVECDACRFACGTCYCFVLSESEKTWEKVRSWDSCQSVGYGRVAGGANPRKTKTERLRNEYMCKLVYRPENFGIYACTGCGRCIEVCQGKIDIRKSLQKLSHKK